MAPKEKVQELIDKFSDLEDGEMYIGKAKKCALIAVDEILNNFGTLTEGKKHYSAYCTIKYYEEVKQEINNL